ncbi:hypothetical protein, partial [Agromyces sp. NPDC058126]|uniref:hypothetical protein n=1 Tax=Agromyces sp. NPDC058126 TaxID=3346350 RepID=UPI0036DAEC31
TPAEVERIAGLIEETGARTWAESEAMARMADAMAELRCSTDSTYELQTLELLARCIDFSSSDDVNPNTHARSRR